MSAKKESDKPTGVNKGIKEGMDPSEFQGRVICKKCGKDIEYTMGSTLHLKCPRCQAKIERDLKSENKEVDQIIKYDIIRRAKKYSLQFGFVLTCIAIAYNIVGFFTEWFSSGYWWLGLMSIPLVLLSFAFTRTTRLKSSSKKYRFFAWLALILNVVAVLLIVITSVPYINEKLVELYEKTR